MHTCPLQAYPPETVPVNGVGGSALHKEASEFMKPTQQGNVRPVRTGTALVERRSRLVGEMSAGGQCGALQGGGSRSSEKTSKDLTVRRKEFTGCIGPRVPGIVFYSDRSLHCIVSSDGHVCSE